MSARRRRENFWGPDPEVGGGEEGGETLGAEILVEKNHQYPSHLALNPIFQISSLFKGFKEKHCFYSCFFRI